MDGRTKKKIECPKKIMVIKKIEQTEINSKNSPELAVVEQKKKKNKRNLNLLCTK